MGDVGLLPRQDERAQIQVPGGQFAVDESGRPGAGRHLPYATRELVAGERLPCDVDRRVRLGPPGSGRLSVVAPSAGE